MPDSRPAIFDEVARIEEQAEKVLADARAQAQALRRAAEEQIRAVAEEAERKIEQRRAELAQEYKAKTAQALAQIEAAFAGEKEALNALRESRFDGLVKHALSALRRQLLGDGSVQASEQTTKRE